MAVMAPVLSCGNSKDHDQDLITTEHDEITATEFTEIFEKNSFSLRSLWLKFLKSKVGSKDKHIISSQNIHPLVCSISYTRQIL
jgi:hypothetical protein